MSLFEEGEGVFQGRLPYYLLKFLRILLIYLYKLHTFNYLLILRRLWGISKNQASATFFNINDIRINSNRNRICY